jgi:hypothetical protein
MPNHVLQVASTGGGIIEKDLISTYSNVWIEMEFAIDSVALADILTGGGFGLPTQFDLFKLDATSGWAGAEIWVTADSIGKWAAFNSVNDPSSTPVLHAGISAMQFYKIKMHVVAGSPFTQTVSIDGANIGTINVSGAISANIRYLDIFQTGLIDAGFLYFDNIKIGSTEGANDIFLEDFEGGDLSQWTSVDSGFSIIVDPGIAAAVPFELPTAEPGNYVYKWTMKLFNYDGSTPVTADYSDYSFDTTSNEIFHATNRNMNFYLNGVDDASFTLYLDDPIASLIIPTKSYIKIWRHIYEPDGISLIYEDESDIPAFAGVVQSTSKDGDANTMQVKAFSPLWRLQTRFHVNNHYLVIDQGTGDPYTGSGIIFKLIDLLNSAFPATGDEYTGIEIGTASWGGEPEMSPYFVAKGSVTWALISDDVMSRPAAADIVPVYNDDGSNINMYLNTEQKRGADRSATIEFRYHTGTNDNCENITDEISANPGDFANFLWVIGHGGANSGKVAIAWDNDSGDFDSDSIGLYMKTVDKSEVKRLKALKKIAEAELAQSRIPKSAITVTLSPYGGLFFANDFKVGDVVKVIADKNALQANKKQRIYQVGLTISDNNVETASPLVSKDFYGKVAADA